MGQDQIPAAAQRDEVTNTLQKLHSDIQQADEERTARNLAEQGCDFDNAGVYERAVTVLQKSYRMVPGYEVLDDLARAQHRAEHYAKARAAYERYLREGGASLYRTDRRIIKKNRHVTGARGPGSQEKGIRRPIRQRPDALQGAAVRRCPGRQDGTDYSC